MADKITTEKRLALIAGFADEDDRTISIPDPKDNITSSDIEQLNPLAQGVLIGDKYGAEFTSFKKATIIDSTETTFDLK